MTKVKAGIVIAIVPIFVLGALEALRAYSMYATDPGVRPGVAGAGAPFPSPPLTASQLAFFDAGKDDFEETEFTDEGLGPRFNLDSCKGCHIQPALGGSSPEVNPQVAVATAMGATNKIPSFISLDGPVREARFKYNANGTPDGGVHSLFVVTGRSDADGCSIAQEDFEAQVLNNNISFRIPTPTFGAGLIEMVPDRAIDANRKALSGPSSPKEFFRINGRANHNGNDGSIARFGWKAQNKSLLLFAGEAYNVEMGITSELFQTEREENGKCQYASEPNSVTNTDEENHPGIISSIERFAMFMRFLAPPVPAVPWGIDPPSVGRGRKAFDSVGCALCHTPTLKTGSSTVAALAYRNVNLFSDLLVHNMGPGLADDISQGQAGGDEFRSAPLWGLGQRIFFLHDGRTKDLVEAIRAHRSAGSPKYKPSEANVSVDAFDALPERSTDPAINTKQDLLNFLRSL